MSTRSVEAYDVVSTQLVAYCHICATYCSTKYTMSTYTLTMYGHKVLRGYQTNEKAWSTIAPAQLHSMHVFIS